MISINKRKREHQKHGGCGEVDEGLDDTKQDKHVVKKSKT